MRSLFHWYVQGCIQVVWETGILVWVPKLWHPNNTFQVLFFPSDLNKKYDEAAIRDFTMHQIISKWLRTQKCRQKRKTLRPQDVEAKEEIACESVFIYLKRNRSWKCLLFLLDFFRYLLQVINDVNSLPWFMWFLIYYLLHLFSSDHFNSSHKFIAIQTLFFNVWIT